MEALIIVGSSGARDIHKQSALKTSGTPELLIPSHTQSVPSHAQEPSLQRLHRSLRVANELGDKIRIQEDFG
jgi:hypothetical protein